MVPKNLALYALPIFLLLIAWEILLFRKNARRFPWKEAGISLAMALIYGISNQHIAVYLASFNQFFYEHRLMDIPANTVWGFTLLFFAEEFAYYWLHRCAHEIRWLWASHSVHHSPTSMTLSGAYRLSLTGAVSGLFIFFVPLFLLGFSPKAVALMFGANLVYQFWLHTEWIPKLGWFEYVFNTPSHHRVHHGTNPEYIDRNYGGILIIFDRIFGTLAIEKIGVPIQYGLIGKQPSLNPLKLFFQEWLAIIRDVCKAQTWRDRFLLAFGRPGWPFEHKPKAAGTSHAEPHTAGRRRYKIG